MIPIFEKSRRHLTAGLVVVAIAHLAASIFVARNLHRAAHDGSMHLIVFVAVVAFLLEVGQRRIGEAVGLAYTSAVREALFRHLMTVDPQLTKRRRHGAMLQSFVGDLTALRQWVSEGIARIIVAVLALTGILVWLAFTMPDTAAALGTVVAATCLIGAALLRPLNKSVRAVRRRRGRVAAFASERLSNSATVQAFGRAASETSRLNRRVAQLNRASYARAWITGALRALPPFAATVMMASAIVSGEVTSAQDMTALMIVIGIIGLGLRDLARAAELMVPGQISRDRIAALLALPTHASAEGHERLRGENNLFVVDGIRIAASSTPFDAMARRGDIVLVDGEVELRHRLLGALAGLSCSEEGMVRWTGRSLTRMKATRRRAIVGVVHPDLPVIEGSNGFNLRYRASTFPKDELEQQARIWDIDLAGRGGNPTHVALLRALIGRPPVLILELGESSIGEPQIEVLLAELKHWDGVIVLASNNPKLRALASVFWRIDETGIHSLESAAPPFSLVHSVGRSAVA